MHPRAKKALKVVGLSIGALVALVAIAVAVATAQRAPGLEYPDAVGPALPALPSDAALIEEGRYLVHVTAHCSQCHSSADRENPAAIATAPLHGGLEFVMGPLGTRYAHNLTPHATGIAQRSDAELARTIRTGVLPDGELSLLMRFSGASVSDHDLMAILAYLRLTAPVENEVPPGEWSAAGRVILAYLMPTVEPRAVEGPEHVPPSPEPSVARGEYLANHVMMCGACHTALDPMTLQAVGEPFAGSLADPSHGSDADMEFVAPNLTPHATGITGLWDEEQFVARFRAGRMYTSSIMPWDNFAGATDTDLRSVYRFLKTVPPVETNLGPSYRPRGSWAN